MGPGSIAASVRSVRSILSGSTDTGARIGGRIVEDNSSASSDGSSTSSDSDSDSDSESVFIYSRVARLPPTFFRKDPVSTCHIASGVHVYGTHSGMLHICKPDTTPVRTVRVHRSSVLDITSSNNEFVATASIDGTVVISGINDPTDIVQASFRRPVHAIALHPDYNSHRSYISGGTAGQVVLSERGWLKSRSDTVLSQTQSTILALSWPLSSRLLWCNEDGITTYNPESRIVINVVPRGPHSPRADLFRPRIYIDNASNNALVAWHKTVFVVNFQSGELVKSFEFQSTLAGAITFPGINQIAVLAVDKQQPELRLVDFASGQESYEDELELLGGARLGVNDYHLATGERSKLWIVSCSDAVIARERTARDHVDWLLQYHRYTDAYAASKIRQAEVSDDERKQIGLKATHQLISLDKWEAATHLLPEILGEQDRAEWLMWSNHFLKADQHLLWGDILPMIELSGVHDAVLDAALDKRDLSRLSLWVKSWPLNIFNGNELAHKLEQATKDNEKSDQLALQDILASVWLKLDEYVKAVQAFVAANSAQAFHVTNHYHLWTEPEVEKMLGLVLSSGDGEDGTGIYVDRLRELIRCRAEISPSRVVHQLEQEESKGGVSGQDLLLFGYLTELGLVDETWLGEFADLMVRLYTKYDPQKLLGFLERFDTYDIDASIKICREKHLDNELVYLLGCVGKFQESLEIMVKKLQDYDHAVSFARSQGPETWDHLISYCSEHPGLVLALLKCVEVSPARVLATVPESMRIPGLKQALCKVLNSQEVSLELNEGALEIVRSESLQWTKLLRALRLQGTQIENPESDDFEEPQLISDTGREKVKFKNYATSFSGKIGHLRSLLGL